MPPIISCDVAAARYEHGTRARYQLGKCHCFECKVANADYEVARLEAKRLPWRVRHMAPTRRWIVCNTGTSEIVFSSTDRDAAFAERDRLNAPFARKPEWELIGTAAVRRHVAKLRSAGISKKSICRSARVNRGVLDRILLGEIKKTRRSTAARILAVTDSDHPDGNKIDATATWVLLDRLIAVGYRKRRIAKDLGRTSPALQLSRKSVTIKNAKAVVKLYAELWARNPMLQRLHPIQRATPAFRKPTWEHMSLDEFSIGVARLLAS
jgi:hypothetical protein